MASYLIANALQVNFDSVLGFLDYEGMVNMFKALEFTGLRGFLGCPSVLYEQELDQFFDTATMWRMYQWIWCMMREAYLKSGEPVKTSCKKRKMKYEFLLLNDILAKSITVKAGSFDVVTRERFLLMTAIHFGLKFNWSKILFDILNGMAKTFPPQKILTVKTVGTYVAKNKIIGSDEDEPAEPVAKKAATNRRPAPAVVEPAAKNMRTIVGKDASTEKDLALVPVVQNPEPISVVPAATPKAQRRRAPKRKLVMQEGSDDEIF
ncbi:hypothetical protein F511_22725 [Dorcoceras hygrometricum]|uniref:Uncharacterized protein n=1 Tax=Dorcoceras hygrometricum TaxID=472368 RepID=A0A2Z7CNK9_9LAMI|nr:hypothetical protein F511_22725 [Dorcoceras hygrometricum]